MTAELGYFKDEKCNRNGCKGIIIEKYASFDEGCSCHICPPCGFCTVSRSYCEDCGWNGREKQQKQYDDYYAKNPVRFHEIPKERVLDKTKIDYKIYSHSNSSMQLVGVYPENLSRKEVFEKVKGTFGGRFTRFENGEFEFISYTD
jgi:hypothetical protein